MKSAWAAGGSAQRKILCVHQVWWPGLFVSVYLLQPALFQKRPSLIGSHSDLRKLVDDNQLCQGNTAVGWQQGTRAQAACITESFLVVHCLVSQEGGRQNCWTASRFKFQFKMNLILEDLVCVHEDGGLCRVCCLTKIIEQLLGPNSVIPQSGKPVFCIKLMFYIKLVF